MGSDYDTEEELLDCQRDNRKLLAEVGVLKKKVAAAEARNECPACGLTPGPTAERWCAECVGELEQAARWCHARLLMGSGYYFRHAIEQWPWLAKEGTDGT